MEVHAKVLEYEHFLNERLRSDLKKVCSLNTNACWDSHVCHFGTGMLGGVGRRWGWKDVE